MRPTTSAKMFRIKEIPDSVVARAKYLLQEINLYAPGKPWDVVLFEDDFYVKVVDHKGRSVSPEFNHGYSLLSWLEGWMNGYTAAATDSRQIIMDLSTKLHNAEYQEWCRPKITVYRINENGHLYFAKSSVSGQLVHPELPAISLTGALKAVAELYRGIDYQLTIEE